MHCYKKPSYCLITWRYIFGKLQESANYVYLTTKTFYSKHKDIQSTAKTSQTTATSNAGDPHMSILRQFIRPWDGQSTSSGLLPVPLSAPAQQGPPWSSGRFSWSMRRCSPRSTSCGLTETLKSLALSTEPHCHADVVRHFDVCRSRVLATEYTGLHWRQNAVLTPFCPEGHSLHQ